VVEKSKWHAAVSQGFYEADSLNAEGFIHASKKTQVEGVLQRYYAGRQNLLLLHIDENNLTSGLKYEMSPTLQEEFPHIFGPLNLDAVVNVTEL
jgi:uncharacterized protein (DUF952 family)